jgi:hypothetical protein
MENGFPNKYNLFPTIDRITDVATRLGRFLSPQTTELYLSSHIKEQNKITQPELPFES